MYTVLCILLLLNDVYVFSMYFLRSCSRARDVFIKWNIDHLGAVMCLSQADKVVNCNVN